MTDLESEVESEEREGGGGKLIKWIGVERSGVNNPGGRHVLNTLISPD